MATYTPQRSSRSITPVARNAFSGQLHIPSKRSGSFADTDRPKIPRIGFRGGSEELRQGLDEGLRAYKEELRAELSEARRFREEPSLDLKAEVRSLREWLQEGRAQDLQALEEQSRTHLALLKTTLGSMETNLGNLRTEASAHQDEVRAHIVQLRSALEARLGAFEASFDMKTERILSAKAPPQPQEPRFHLARECPAPEGEGQRQYGSRLFRACLLYIYILWDSFYDEDGVGQDFHALEEVKKRLPDLNELAIVKALQHFHNLVFNRPLGQQGGDGDKQASV